MSFYVTLPSHANRQEFPNNQANGFKIRLPQPLRLGGEGWQVGLSSISIPDTTLNLSGLAPVGEDIMGMGCYRVDTNDNVRLETQNLPLKTIQDDISVVDGVSFMKKALKWFDKRFTELFWRYYGYKAVDNGKNTCPLFKWENQDLLLDNSSVARRIILPLAGLDYMPHVAFNKHLALKMGWFKENAGGGFTIGPNLLMIYPNGRVPAKNEYDWRTTRTLDPLYYTSRTDQNQVTWIYLSMRVSWKFAHLNVAFRSVVKEPTRSLHVYSDVGTSTMVGNRMTDLLREIKYHREARGSMYFEPLHVQYLPVRNQVMEIIEIQIAETIGAGEDLVQFGPGHSIVTLHFKREDKD